MSHTRGVVGYVFTIVLSLAVSLAAGIVSGVCLVALLYGQRPSRGDITAIAIMLALGLIVVLVTFLTADEALDLGSEDTAGLMALSMRCAVAGILSIGVPLFLVPGRLWSVETAVIAFQAGIAGGLFPRIIKALTSGFELLTSDLS